MSAPRRFLAACRGEPHDRVPVWFMRQAGRSLPEYRAVRGEGSILDAIRQPELAAEITLQPVRRYGVDAAILYSDIVVPAVAIGFGVDVAPGHRAGRRAARSRRRPTSTGCARSTPRPTRRTCSRPSRKLVAELPRRRAAHRLRRRAVHGGQLPRRGPAVAHLRADEGADARRPRRCSASCSTALADLAADSIASQVGAGARAFQLFDSWAGALTPAQYERHVLPHSRTVFSRLAGARRARHPLRRQHRRAARPDGRRRAPTSWASTGARRCRSPARGSAPGKALQGNLDPAVCLGPWDAVAAEVAGRARRATAVTPATSSTSATACCPRPTRRCSSGSSRWCTARTRVNGAGSSSWRTGRRRRSTTSRRTTRTSAGARPPTAEQLADLRRALRGHRRHVAAARRSPTRRPPASADALGDEWLVAVGHEARVAVHRGRGVVAGGEAGVERIVGVVLAPHYSRGSVGEYVGRLRATAAEHGVPAAAVESWHDLPEYVAFLAAAVRDGLAGLPARTKVLFTAHSLPERVLEGDPYPDELHGVRQPPSPPPPAWSRGRAGAWPGSRRAARPSRGAAPTSSTCSTTSPAPAGPTACSCARRGSSPTTSRCSTTSTSWPPSAPRRSGLAFARTRSLNDDPTVLAALAERVRGRGGVTSVRRRRWRHHRAGGRLGADACRPRRRGHRVRARAARREAAHVAVRRPARRRGRRRLPRPGARGARAVRRARARRPSWCRRRRGSPTWRRRATCTALPDGLVLGVPTDPDALRGSPLVGPPPPTGWPELRRPASRCARRGPQRSASSCGPLRRRGARAARRPAARRHQRRRQRPPLGAGGDAAAGGGRRARRRSSAGAAVGRAARSGRAGVLGAARRHGRARGRASAPSSVGRESASAVDDLRALEADGVVVATPAPAMARPRRRRRRRACCGRSATRRRCW